MNPSVLYDDPKKTSKAKPSQIWVLITILAGAVGALAAIAVGGTGTYEIAPFTVELSARPDLAGKTEIALAPSDEALDPSDGSLAAAIPKGRAEAGTHAGPIVFRVTFTGLSESGRLTTTDQSVFADPLNAASFMADDGKAAVRAFGIKLALLALAGATAAGLAIGFRRFRRVVGAAIAGLLCFAAIGLVVQQTYDKGEFSKTSYVFEDPVTPTTPNDLLPTP